MQLRDFVKLLSSAAAAWLGTVFGQQPNQVGRIGVLMEGVEAEPDYRSYLAAFVQGPRHLGGSKAKIYLSMFVEARANSELAWAYSSELRR
jgi:hypothetical protein